MVSVEFEGHRASLETTFDKTELSWYTCVIVGEEVSTTLPHKLPLYKNETGRDKFIILNLKLFIDAKPAVIQKIVTKLINEAAKHKQNIDKLTHAPLPTAEEIAEFDKRTKELAEEVAAEEAEQLEREARAEAAKKAELELIEKYCKILRNEDGNSTPELVEIARIGLKSILMPTFCSLSEKHGVQINKLNVVDYMKHAYKLVRFGTRIWRYDWLDACYTYDTEDEILKQEVAGIQAKLEIQYEKMDKEGNIVDVLVKYNGNFTGDRDQIINQASFDGRVCKESPFNQYPAHINTKSGVLKLDYKNRSVELIGKNPDYMFNYCIAAEYDKFADGKIIDKFIEEVVGPDQKDIIYQIPALAIRDTDITLSPSKVVYWLQGPKNSGKNALMLAISTLLGRKNVTSIPLHALTEDKYVKASLEGKLLNFDDEAPVSLPVNESREIKTLTGGKIQNLNPKGVQAYDGIITALLVFAGNHFPKCYIPESDDAFWERWDVIHFRNQFKVDEKFSEKLLTPENMSGFLNNVIEKLFDMYDKGIRRISTHEQVYAEWQYSSSTVYKFVQDMMEPTNTPHHHIKSELHQQYLNWCEKHHEAKENIRFQAEDFGKEILRVCKAENSKHGQNTTYKMFRSLKPQNNQTINNILKCVTPEPISVADDWGQHSN